MGNKSGKMSEADVRAIETSGRHLNEAKDPQVKRMSKRLEAIKMQVASGTPPDIKALFDQLAVDGKIDKTNFSILLRGSLNFAVKNAIMGIIEGPKVLNSGMTPQECAAQKASKKEAIEKVSQAMPEGMPGRSEAVTAVAVAIKAVDRLDLHAIKILDRIFVCLDKDNSGSLEFEEIQSFVTDIMRNPQNAIDPFRFIGVPGSDKITTENLSEMFCDIFTFMADLMIQFVDLIEEVACSNDVLRACELDSNLWAQFFGAVGGNGMISKKQFKAFLAQAPWEEINAAFKKEINNPAQAALWQHSMQQLVEFREALLAGISETGSVEEGLARAYAWLKNGVDETTFMSNVLPSMRKYIQEQNTPDKIAESMRTALQSFCLQMKSDPNLMVMMAQAQPIFAALEPKIAEPGFLEGIFAHPVVMGVFEKFNKSYDEKLPIILHHCFRFCDINSDGGVSESEMKVLFALKDAMVDGRLDEAAVHIFEVIDKDGNEEVSSSELLAFFSKCIHFMCAVQRVYISMIFETMLPEVIKAALPLVAQAVGITEVTKEQLPGVIMMAQMQMVQAQGMAMQLMAPPGNEGPPEA